MNLIKLFTTTSSVLICYVAIRSIQFIFSLFWGSESLLTVTGRAMSFFAALVLVYLTFKRNLIACWTLVCLLILSGISIILYGVFSVAITHYLFKIINIIIGAYLIYGSIMLIKSIRKGEMKFVDSLVKKA